MGVLENPTLVCYLLYELLLGLRYKTIHSYSSLVRLKLPRVEGWTSAFEYISEEVRVEGLSLQLVGQQGRRWGSCCSSGVMVLHSWLIQCL
jgi:hypothetical protein